MGTSKLTRTSSSPRRRMFAAMVGVWVWPETADNPRGVFTYLNNDLFRMQQRVEAAP